MTAVPEPTPNYITEEQLDNKLNGFLSQIAGMIDQKPVKEVKRENVDFYGNKIQDVGLPPEWRELVDRYLGEEYGAELDYPTKGKGFVFHIYVPEEKSNADPSYMMMYKKDVRSTPLNPSEGIEGAERWIKTVARNLGIDIRFKR